MKTGEIVKGPTVFLLNKGNRHTDFVSLGIKEEVGPVWISLHESELKKLPQAQRQDVLTNLRERNTTVLHEHCGDMTVKKKRSLHSTHLEAPEKGVNMLAVRMV